jgi:hypothetical protein
MQSNIGTLIDEGYSIMLDNSRFRTLHQVLPLKFDYLYTSQLLECIKARLVIPRIKEHLALGRKIVIFHSYNHSLPSHPFNFDDVKDKIIKLPDAPRIREEISLFSQLYPQFEQLDLHDLKNPIKTFKEAFGSRVGFYNGNVTKMERDYIVKKFNQDDSFKDILVAQVDAGREGISLHDTTGIHQRVTITLGLPVKPTTVPQLEGRTFREGVKSDAIYEYAVLKTNFEKFIFAEKISKRTRTAENLAVGSQARNFEQSIKEGYLNAKSEAPSIEQGKGGKESDMKINTDTEFDKAKISYKVSTEQGLKELPEPIGLKIVELLDYGVNEKLLEPFARYGSIARYYPETTLNDFIEPDINKRATVAVNCIKYNKVSGEHFKEMKMTKFTKYYGIAFNEIEKGYQLKAFQHLKDTGRMIIVTKELTKDVWSQDIAVTRFEIKLPIMLNFKNIICVDKVLNEYIRCFMPEKVVYDFRGISDMDRLFEEINKIEVIKRLVKP